MLGSDNYYAVFINRIFRILDNDPRCIFVRIYLQMKGFLLICGAPTAMIDGISVPMTLHKCHYPNLATNCISVITDVLYQLIIY